VATQQSTLPGGIKPLGMTCTSTDCANGLHFFRPKPVRKRKEIMTAAIIGGVATTPTDASRLQTPSIPPRGACRVCGTNIVNWNRVTRRDISDAVHTFTELRKEGIRNFYWNVDFDGEALRKARQHGRRALDEQAEREIRRKVGKDTGFDGRQTPTCGNVLYYAMHATATCCRKCIEEWHAIPRGRPLEDDEVNYLTNLVRIYIGERLPDLSDEGEEGPCRRPEGSSRESAVAR